MCDATSAQLSEVMKQRAQNVILIIQLCCDSEYASISLVLKDDMYTAACPVLFEPKAYNKI